MNLTFYVTVSYTYKTFIYISFITIHLQLRSVNVAIAECFRVKCLMSNVGSVKGLRVEKMVYAMGSYIHL